MKITPGQPPTIANVYARFKVYPGGRSKHWYWTVLVFQTKAGMRRAFHTLNMTDDKDDRFGAIVMPCKVQQFIKGRWRSVDHSLGNVLLARSQLNVETHCHEALHMAMGFLREVKAIPRLKRETDFDEERLAYCTGRCAAQLNHGLYKTESYKK